MALQSSGAITINQIRSELGSGSYSLRTLSAAAGKSTPDAMSEFYGYSNVTCHLWQFYNSSDPGFPDEHFTYMGCNGVTQHLYVSVGTGQFGCVKDGTTPPVGDQGDNPTYQGVSCT